MRKQPVIASAGELLVEFVAGDRNGRHRRTSAYTGPFPSGAPGIFIDQAAKLGAHARFAGAVGDDAFGQVILDRFRADGVATDLIRTVTGVPTGSAFVSYNDDGSRDFVFNIAHAAAARLAPAPDIAAALLAQDLDVFHLSGSSLGDPKMAETLLELARRLHAEGVAISFDPNVRKELIGDPAYRRTVERLVHISRYFLPSEEDFSALFSGESLDAIAARLFATGTEVVVLKRGERGALGVTRAGAHADLPAFPVSVADPTGAGDCFCATLVTLLAAGDLPFPTALRYANAAGALAVGRVGPMEGNSTPDEIAALLKERTP